MGGIILEKDAIRDDSSEKPLKDAERNAIANVSAAEIYKKLYNSMLSSDKFKEQVSKVPAIADKIAAFKDIEMVSSFLDLNIQAALEYRKDSSNMYYKHPDEIAVIKIISEALSKKFDSSLRDINKSMNPYGNPRLNENFNSMETALDVIASDIDLLTYRSDENFKYESMSSILSSLAWLSIYLDKSRTIKMSFLTNIDLLATTNIAEYLLLSLTRTEAEKLFNYVNSKYFDGAFGTMEAFEESTNGSFTEVTNDALRQMALPPSSTFEKLALFSIVALLKYSNPSKTNEVESIVTSLTGNTDVSGDIIDKIKALAGIDAKKGNGNNNGWNVAYL